MDLLKITQANAATSDTNQRVFLDLTISVAICYNTLGCKEQIWCTDFFINV
jgi:hypothetical protein